MQKAEGPLAIWLKYRWNEGMVAFLLSRCAALVVAFYLVAHLMVTRTLAAGQPSFDGAMHTVGRPIFKLLEIGLIGVIIAHAIQGSRIVALNLGVKSRHRKMLLIVIGLIGLALFLVGAWMMFPYRSHTP
jgi:succinate dehydrogenase / fumarate reductase cytochrome b subunit